MSQGYYSYIHTREKSELHPHKNSHINVNCSITYNRQNVETTFISKLLNGYTKYNRVSFSKTQDSITGRCYKINETWKYYTKWKTLVTKDHVIYESFT